MSIYIYADNNGTPRSISCKNKKDALRKATSDFLCGLNVPAFIICDGELAYSYKDIKSIATNKNLK